MNVELDRSPEAGQITCDRGMAAPRYPIMLQGVLRVQDGDQAVLSLTCDYHIKEGHVVSRLVRDREKNPNWPNSEPGQNPSRRAIRLKEWTERKRR